jgi:hypothetical protein
MPEMAYMMGIMKLQTLSLEGITGPCEIMFMQTGYTLIAMANRTEHVIFDAFKLFLKLLPSPTN